MSTLSSPTKGFVELSEFTGPSSLENGIMAKKVIGEPISGTSRIPTYTTFSSSTSTRPYVTLEPISNKITYTTYKISSTGTLQKVVECGELIPHALTPISPAPPSPSKDLKPGILLRSRIHEESGPTCAPCTE